VAISPTIGENRNSFRQILLCRRSTNLVTYMEDAHADPLVVGLAAGDERAFAVLYDQYGGRLYRAAVGMLGRREDAEDAVQEVFTAVLRSRLKLADVQNLTAYLFTALRRAVGRSAASRAREPRTGDAGIADVVAKADPADHPGVDGERLQKALLALPVEQREVIALKIDGGLTFAEIAQVMGIGPNTAASRYRYALEKLRGLLTKGCGGGEGMTAMAAGSAPPSAPRKGGQ
jgi:RNA polymerase sigma-70 factor, ECF subfamily